MKNSDLIFGIDLGTTNSCCTLWRNKNLEIIKERINGKNLSLIPSVAYIDDNHITVGNKAINKNPLLTINNSKRLIGRNFDDEYVKNFKKYLSFPLNTNNNNEILIKTKSGLRKPEEISAMILSKIKTLAKEYANISTDTINAIITIPAYFNESQRRATHDAAKIAGINCLRMINEPTAAALSYGILGKKDEEEKNIIVYDFGGGTLDVSLLNIDDGIFEVIATTGDSYLGGEDFTQALFQYVVNDFKKKVNLDENEKIKIHQDKLKQLKQLCEDGKIKLSKIDEIEIKIDNLWGTNNLKIKITRELFQNICKELLDRAIQPVIEIMKTSDTTIDDINEVLLVGGTTQIPVIQFMLHNYFNIKPTISSNPDFIVSAGAAIQGYMLQNQDDPFCKDIVLLDVIPLTLGVETLNGVFSPIIERNSTIPVKITKKYTTDSDNDTEINIKVYEGERKLVKDNFLIGNFILKGIEKAKKGIPVIEITFSVDVNGIINVSAKDIRSESENKIIIDNTSKKYSNEEIELLIKESEKYQKEDFLKQTRIERLNELDEIKEMILYNLSSDEVKLSQNDKKLIYNELRNLFNELDNYDNQQLLKIIEKLKRKYSSLVLRFDNDNENDIKSIDKTEILFSDLNLDTSPSKVPCYDLDLDKNDNNNKLKDNLIAKCNEYLLKLNQNEDAEIINYLHSVIVWANVNIDLTNLDFKTKIDEIEINYKKYNSIEKIVDYKNELLGLCSALITDIDSNNLPMPDNYCNILKNYIINLINWSEKSNYSNNDIEFKNQIEKLNIKCEELYEKSQN